jgi:hypothetical protein
MNVFKLVFIYFIALAAGTVAYLCTFWIPVFANFDFLFVRSFLLLLIVCMLLFGILFLLKMKVCAITRILTFRDIFIICQILFFINWFVYGAIPFNVARSNSVLILAYLN